MMEPRREVHPLARQAFGLMLLYMLGFVLLLTLSPFNFRLTGVARIVIIESWKEAFVNLLLFVPVGFLVALWAGRHWPLAKALLGGALISFCIECLQLLLHARLTSATDLASNTVGAGVGGVLAWGARRWLDDHLVNLRVLELPSVNVLYLLVPLGWLAYLRPASTDERFALAVILSGTGGAVIGALWRYRLGPAGHLPLLATGVVAFAWALLVNALGLRDAPLTSVALAAGGAAVAFAVAAMPGRGWQRGKRFEGVVLKVAASGFVLYWLVNLAVPSNGWTAHWSLVAGWPGGYFGRDISYAFAEAVASLSAAAYLLSALSARRNPGDATEYYERSLAQRLGGVALALSPGIVALAGCLLLGAAYEVAHGFHSRDAASGVRFVLGLGGACIGVALHRVQLRAVIARR